MDVKQPGFYVEPKENYQLQGFYQPVLSIISQKKH
jgi:hypothetical protein